MLCVDGGLGRGPLTPRCVEGEEGATGARICGTGGGAAGL